MTMDGQAIVCERNSGPAVSGVPPTEPRLQTAANFILRPIIPRWKRALDLGMIFLLSPAILPVCAVVALLVKLGSKGPLLFRQPRVGYKGAQFTCFKFRTMRPDAETHSHKTHTQQLIRSKDPMHKLDNRKDPRVIPFGRLLRACGLDELPQMLNVVRGEMSLVGPRPCIPYEYEMYEPWHCQRFDAVPGLTGLWQVSGKNRTTFEQMVKLDIQYARSQSLWLDLKIIFRTFPAIWAQFCELRAARQERARMNVNAVALGKSLPSFRL